MTETYAPDSPSDAALAVPKPVVFPRSTLREQGEQAEEYLREALVSRLDKFKELNIRAHMAAGDIHTLKISYAPRGVGNAKEPDWVASHRSVLLNAAMHVLLQDAAIINDAAWKREKETGQPTVRFYHDTEVPSESFVLEDGTEIQMHKNQTAIYVTLDAKQLPEAYRVAQLPLERVAPSDAAAQQR